MGAAGRMLADDAKVHVAVLGDISADTGAKGDDPFRAVLFHKGGQRADEVRARVGWARRQVELVEVLEARNHSRLGISVPESAPPVENPEGAVHFRLMIFDS